MTGSCPIRIWCLCLWMAQAPVIASEKPVPGFLLALPLYERHDRKRMRKRNRRRRRNRLILYLVIAVVGLFLVRWAIGRRSLPTETAAEAGSIPAAAAEKTAGPAGTSPEISESAGTGAETAADETGGRTAAAAAELPAGGQGGQVQTVVSGSADAGSGTGTSAGSNTIGSTGEGNLRRETAGLTGSTGATAAAAVPAAPKQTELEKGKEYLDSLDRRQPIEVEYMIDKARVDYENQKQKLAYVEEREKYRDKLEDGDVWDKFKDYVFLGDSRVVGYDVFGFLPSERVLAEAGDTILRISEHMDTLKEMDPDYIFISYGINDIGIGLWPTAEEYAEDFGKRLEELRKELPEARIFVNSIIPATDEAVAGVSIWGKIPEYSEAVRKVCQEKEIPFIDNDSLIKDHHDLYAGDGVHLQSDFYPYWAEEQILAVFDLDHGRTADGTPLEEVWTADDGKAETGQTGRTGQE